MTQLHDLRLRLLVQQESERIADSQPTDLDLSVVQARCLSWLALLAEAMKTRPVMRNVVATPSRPWAGLPIRCVFAT